MGRRKALAVSAIFSAGGKMYNCRFPKYTWSTAIFANLLWSLRGLNLLFIFIPTKTEDRTGIEWGPEFLSSKKVLILTAGNRHYNKITQRAFPNQKFKMEFCWWVCDPKICQMWPKLKKCHWMQLNLDLYEPNARLKQLELLIHCLDLCNEDGNFLSNHRHIRWEL